MPGKKRSINKSLVYVIIAALLAAHAAVLLWGLITHWTQHGVVFLSLLIGLSVGYFVRRGSDTSRVTGILVAVIVTIWGVFLGYLVNSIIFTSAYVHHSYWTTFRVVGFSHLIQSAVAQLGMMDGVFIGMSLALSGVLASKKV